MYIYKIRDIEVHWKISFQSIHLLYSSLPDKEYIYICNDVLPGLTVNSRYLI